MRTILLALVYTGTLFLFSGFASAATIFDSGQIRFGDGTEDSINSAGLPKQPFITTTVQPNGTS